jgi:hypothetical protein
MDIAKKKQLWIALGVLNTNFNYKLAIEMPLEILWHFFVK